MPEITIKNRRMNYLDVGRGEVLLFGHSFLWDHQMWREQVRILSRDYRCIVPDLWGHGGSAPPPDDVSIESLADDYWQLMQALDIESFSIIGLSVGGMWGTCLALDHPASVNALILMDTYVGAEPEETRRLYFSMLDESAKLGMIPAPVIERIVPLFFAPTTLQGDFKLVESFRKSLSDIFFDKVPGIVTLGKAIFGRRDMMDELVAVNVPTLVVVGEHDIPRPLHESQAMVDRIEGARLEVIKSAGHISCLEQPQEVTEVLSKFLEEVLDTA